jgi:hypothetical protein
MAITVAQMQARKETIFTKLAEMDDLLDASEEGTSINVTAKRNSYLMELKELDRQISAISMSGQSVTWLGSEIEDQYIETGP